MTETCQDGVSLFRNIACTIRGTAMYNSPKHLLAYSRKGFNKIMNRSPLLYFAVS